MKELLEKYNSGGLLTDLELENLLNHYNELEKLLYLHDISYRLVLMDVYSNLRILNGFKEARKR